MEINSHLHALTDLTLWIETWYPSGRRLREPQSLSELCGGNKSILLLPGMNPGPPSPYPIAIRNKYPGYAIAIVIVGNA
jgi:hypothetical protein